MKASLKSVVEPVADSVPEPLRGPSLSIVVPTFKESGSIAELCSRLEAVLGPSGWEVVFVDDDSPDGTAALARSISQSDARVRIIQRIGRRGLSSACVEGILSSSAPIVAVMDADLQHDEAALPAMVELVRSGQADIAVGTRYAGGGSTGDWDSSREKMSRTATWLSQLVTGGVKLSDPMSGFFAMKRETFDGVVRGLSALGFKILLDIVATAKKDIRVAEVPYQFRVRTSGESKLDTQVLWEFFLLLIDKKFGKWVPARFVSFAAIGGMGVVVHFAVLEALRLLGESFTLSQTAAAIVAMVFNYSLNNVLTYRDRRRTGWRWLTGLISFAAVCSIGAAANVGVASYLFENQSTGWILSALAGILMGAVWNYAVSSVYTWRK